MQGNGESIEPSTMNYVFDMFGKSVSQMLQQSITQQTMIDELRAQLRSVQTQVTNVCNTLEDFEDKLFVKVQEMRPTIYTRDGIPIDDALEMLQNKISACTDKTQSQVEIIDRLDAEMKQKVDSEQFETAFKSTSQSEESYQEMFLTIQTLQKDLQKQRADSDSMSERVMQMVQLKLEQFTSNKSTNLETDSVSADNSEYVTKSVFEREINRIRQNPFSLPGLDPVEEAGDKAHDKFAAIQMQQEQLEKAYLAQKAKLGENLDQLIAQLDEEESTESTEIPDDFLVESDFTFEDDEPEKEVEFRSISIDNDGNVDDEEIYTDKKHFTSSRRSIGLQCHLDKKNKTSRKQALLEQIRKKKEEEGKQKSSYSSNVDETKIQNAVLTNVMGKVENMLIDFFSMQSNLKLDKNDAKTLVTQLSTVQQLKDDISKLKILVRGKKDTVRCDQELEIRITRNDFFNYLATIFPNNPLIQKCITNIRNGLPPLKKESPRSRPKTSIDEEAKTKQRTIKTASQQPNLVPARNSRLLALNQKFLRGADGRYYLRDMGGEASLVMTPNITGNTKKEVQADDAFDFQPFQPANVPKTETNDRPLTSTKHRSRTPTDATD